jgi:hypothetical protein
MIETGSGKGFPATALQVSFACPISEPNNFQGDGTVETFLSGAKYHP